MKDHVLIVCMTGFTVQQQQQNCIKQLTSLGCKYSKTMTQQVSLLIVKNTATQKYKNANIRKHKVQCVTINWLNDSKKAKKILGFEKYKIKQIFFGLTVGIFGFNKEQSQKINMVLKNNGAKVMQIFSHQNLQAIQLSCLVTKEDQSQNLQKCLATMDYSFVGIEWVQNSIKQKYCKLPKDYAYNYQFLKGQEKQEFMVEKRRLLLQNQISEAKNISLLATSQDYLTNIIVFIDESVEYSVAKALKQNLCIRGGIYLKKPTLTVTHILVNSIQKSTYDNYLKYGDIVVILRVEWLIDSILNKRRLNQQDYKVRHFKKQQKTFSHRQNFISLINIRNYENAKISISQKTQPIKQKQQKPLIFKNLVFHIEPSQRNIKEMFGIATKIRQNGGKLWENGPVQIMHIYLVMSDSPKNKSIYESYKKNNVKQIFTPVSYRWIDYCIQDGKLSPYDNQKYYIFKPFCIQTPDREFIKLKCQVLCKDQSYKRRIQEVLGVLGTSNNTPPNELTHCICNKDYEKSQKYESLVSIKPSIKFIKSQWLLNCLDAGKMIDCSQYMI